jgi:nucleotide-binding universal stress UspA family protein
VTGGVVVGDDGSHGARSALAWAAVLTELTGWPLHVVRAWQLTTAPRPAGWDVGSVPSLPAFEAAVLAELRAGVTEVLGATGAATATCHVVHAHPVAALTDSARQARLLVVGARGRSPMTELLLGSVSGHLTRHAPCPVTVVPPAPD